MPGKMTQDAMETFLAGTHIGVVSVANDGDRPPHASPVWYGYEPGGDITFFTNTMGMVSRKSALVQRAGKLTLTAQTEELPYKYVTVEGTVTRIDRPPKADQMLGVARRYLPEQSAQGMVEEELGRPDGAVVLFTIRPDRWQSVDLSLDG